MQHLGCAYLFAVPAILHHSISSHGNHRWGCVMLSHMQCASIMTFPHALPLGCCRYNDLPACVATRFLLAGRRDIVITALRGWQPDLLPPGKLASCSRAAAWTGFPSDVLLLMSQALELFLSSRLVLLRARLAAGADAQGDSGGSSLAALLRELAALVQDTICQASGPAAIMMRFRPSSGMHFCTVAQAAVTQAAVCAMQSVATPSTKCHVMHSAPKSCTWLTSEGLLQSQGVGGRLCSAEGRIRDRESM